MAKEDAIKRLRKLLPPGSKVYCLLRHCAKSGMSRRIDFFVIRKNTPTMITYAIKEALDNGYTVNKEGGLNVSGGGMDMGFAIVYELGTALYPKGFKLAKNQHGRNGDTSGYDTDGGYSLIHSWL